MDTHSLISALDDEIALLKRVRELLGDPSSHRSVGAARKRRVLSADARKRIVDAQKRRWAAQKAAQKKAAK